VSLPTNYTPIVTARANAGDSDAKKGSPVQDCPSRKLGLIALDLADAGRLQFAVLPRRDFERHGLTFVEGLEALALDLGEVDE